MIREDNDSHEHDVNITKTVSIIIPTKNSANTIGKCLESIKQQTYKNIEILVMDSFSADNTAEIASRFNVQIFFLDGERAKAKNLGQSKAAGEFLLFMDSDMILQPDVVEECIRTCSDNDKIAAIIIPERSIGSEFWVRVRDFERTLYSGSKIESARFFIKRFVSQVGGFDEDVIFYEESTLPQKIEAIGMTVNARTISAILHDERGFNLSKWLSKKRYYSISAKAYSKKYNRYARMQTSIIYRAEILLGEGNWKILIRHPTMSTGLFILKTLEFLVSKRTKRTNLSSRLFPGRHNKTVKTTWDPRVDCKPEVGPRIRFSQNFGKEYIVNAKRILDVGCFIGTYTSLIDKAGCFGIDLDINALKTAKKHCVNSNFIVASVLDLPFRDGIFDLISMWEVIEHVPAGTEKQALTEVHRALATSGAMLLSTPNDSLVCKISDPAFFLRGHRHYRAKKLMSSIAEIGFSVKRYTIRGGWATLVSTNVFYFYKHVLHKKGGKVYTFFEKISDREFSLKKDGVANLFIEAEKSP